MAGMVSMPCCLCRPRRLDIERTSWLQLLRMSLQSTMHMAWRRSSPCRRCQQRIWCSCLLQHWSRSPQGRRRTEWRGHRPYQPYQQHIFGTTYHQLVHSGQQDTPHRYMVLLGCCHDLLYPLGIIHTWSLQLLRMSLQSTSRMAWRRSSPCRRCLPDTLSMWWPSPPSRIPLCTLHT